jgi:hypothetical protein
MRFGARLCVEGQAFGGPSLAGLGPRYATVDKASYGSHVCGTARWTGSISAE